MAKRTYSVRYIAGQPAKRIQPTPVHMLGDSLPIGLPLFAAGETLDVVYGTFINNSGQIGKQL